MTLALDHTVNGVDAMLVPGAPSTSSGKVVNLRGIAMPTGCVVAYLPNQHAIFAPVNPDGTYTVAGISSGTYSLVFLGCTGANPEPTVPDPESPGVSYHAVWWNGIPLTFDQNNGNGGPDPIAQGANLVTVAPGQALTGYDWCFGCTTISIATVTPGSGSITAAFTTPGLVTDISDRMSPRSHSRCLRRLLAAPCFGAPQTISSVSSGVVHAGRHAIREHPLTLVNHGGLALRPRRALRRGGEEFVDRIDRVRVMHAHDPLGPGEVLDWAADVGRLPVDDAGHAIRLQVEEHVLWPEVAVDDHRTFTGETGNRVGCDALQCEQGLTDESQHPRRVSLIEQVLTVTAREEAEGQPRNIEVTMHDDRDG